MAENRHINIPVFVPHMGCPHTCVFCDQRRISGARTQTLENVKTLLEESISTVSDHASIEIAFFGGSFTGIPMKQMISYLEAAKPYIETGRVQGIRLSTRPDYINKEIMEILIKYRVTAIELGVQSLDDEVLRLSRRGHTTRDVENASAMIKDYDVRLGIQTMIGLPGDNLEKTIHTAHKVIGLKPDMVRIYPVLVLKGTELENLYQSGRYTPLALEDAIEWCSQLLPLYTESGITILRIGLHSSETLEGSIIAGPYHPAFGELVESRILLKDLINELNHIDIKFGIKRITIKTRPELVSKLIGHHKCNVAELKRIYGFERIRVIPELAKGDFVIELS